MAEKIQLTEKALALFQWLDKQADARVPGKGQKLTGSQRKAFEELQKKHVASNALGRAPGKPTMAYLLVDASDVDTAPKRAYVVKNGRPPRPSAPAMQALNPADLRRLAADWEQTANAVAEELHEKRERDADELWTQLQAAVQARDAHRLGAYGSAISEKLGAEPTAAEIRAETYRRLNKEHYSGTLRRVLDFMK